MLTPTLTRSGFFLSCPWLHLQDEPFTPPCLPPKSLQNSDSSTMEHGNSAPILSTPAEHILEAPIPVTGPTYQPRLSDDELYVQYEIPRTIREISEGRKKRVALQFPDEMLVDAPRVFELLRNGLRNRRKPPAAREIPNRGDQEEFETSAPEDAEERLCILGDTSYGACCVDEVAAEHVDADIVVHYGRACLSPTARLPVIYVFTSRALNIEDAVTSFEATYPDRGEHVCLLADIPYQHYIKTLFDRLRCQGYTSIFATEVIHDPSSLLPNRTVPEEASRDPEYLKSYSAFHISSPPTSLLLILSSRIKALHIYPTDTASPTTTALAASTTSSLLRRRYALITRLSTAPIFGILINTLSIKNYMSALTHVQSIIRSARKKSYTFVVGKVNAAKLANFAEIGGWVVIGCWESSLIESTDFYRPVITPFELEVALQGDESRLWDGRWVGNFGELLRDDARAEMQTNVHAADEEAEAGANGHALGSWEDQSSDDEPPDFDLRTGQYVSRARPMGRPKNVPALAVADITSGEQAAPAPPSSALVQRPKADVAVVNGTASPAAEFLRSKRTWQGLGSDYEISYERDEEGRIRGAAMEEGRSGVAKGYSVAEAETR